LCSFGGALKQIPGASLLQEDPAGPFARLFDPQQLVIDRVLVLQLHPRHRQRHMVCAAHHQVIADQRRDVGVEPSIAQSLGPAFAGIHQGVGKFH
jgi:hypothetical protein